MKNQLTEQDIQDIIHKTVRQTLGLSAPENKPDQTAPHQPPQQCSSSKTSEKRIVALGTDHGGVDLKAILKQDLIDLGFEVIDCGTHTKDSVDYPDIALKVAELVASGAAWRGVIIDGAGIGSCMAANKVPGVRAALCYDHASAVNSREHNNANVLTLGAGMIGVNLAKQILKTWLATDFGGGRHARRVDKITAIEKMNLTDGK
jgi:ribose 5-phosphate isomerase B